MKNPQHILITGASSGIGEALALFYAQKGTTLFLCAQNTERLSDVAKRCREKERRFSLKKSTLPTRRQWKTGSAGAIK